MPSTWAVRQRPAAVDAFKMGKDPLAGDIVVLFAANACTGFFDTPGSAPLPLPLSPAIPFVQQTGPEAFSATAAARASKGAGAGRRPPPTASSGAAGLRRRGQNGKTFADRGEGAPMTATTASVLNLKFA